MNILILTAHPSSLGHTHLIANAYKEEKEKLGDTVTIVDLYKEENFLPYFAFENIKETPPNETRTRMQQLVTESDELVFVFPIWWSGTPAIMKNWLDHVLAARFAYRYQEGKLVKMLSGKTAKVFATCGGAGWYFNHFFAPFYILWKYAILGYCGIKLTTLEVCEWMSKSDGHDARCTQFIEKVRKDARN